MARHVLVRITTDKRNITATQTNARRSSSVLAIEWFFCGLEGMLGKRESCPSQRGGAKSAGKAAAAAERCRVTQGCWSIGVLVSLSK
eukprot:6464810-Amphidinium_carterae.3